MSSPFRLSISQSTENLAGGFWSWSLWKRISLSGEVLLANEFGFKTAAKALENWESFRDIVTSATPKIERLKNAD